jgi:hypothetical protein
LNYELDTYMDALSGIPQVEKPLMTQKGKATLQKTDIFRKLMWFSYTGDVNWHLVTIEQVNIILKLNETGLQPRSLADLSSEPESDVRDKNEPINADLVRLDKKFPIKSKSKSTNAPKGKFQKPFDGQPQQPRPANQPQQPRPANQPQQPRPANQPQSQTNASVSDELGQQPIKQNKNRNKNRNKNKRPGGENTQQQAGDSAS